MPVFTPGRRWQPPYSPFARKSLGQRVLQAVEIAVKGPLFGCRMCGNCLLQETAFICPMECPKGVRNGPCGGSTEDHCYVDETRPCIWYRIYDRAYRLNRQEMLLEVLPPMDWDKVGGETWGDVARQVGKLGTRKVAAGLLSRDVNKRARTWDSIFRPVRQPDWWRGDSAYHAPAHDQPASELERRLKAGEFVITAEVAPPVSTNLDRLLRNIELIKPYVAAINFTDSPSAAPRTASWACSVLALREGAEPVMQIAARDRTRVGLQSEVMGAADLGIHNMLCISGDSMKMSPAPRGRMDINDVDAVQMLWILRRMRDEGIYLDGREIKAPPRFFLGAAASPFASEPRFQALREHKKVNAGAQFFQTNLVYDAARLEIWLDELARRGILDKVFILIGVTPLKSLRMARHMKDEIPGVVMPSSLMHRMETADKQGNPAEEGLQISLELIEQIRKFEGQGVNGLHIMAVGWEEIVPRLVTEAGLLSPAFVPPQTAGVATKWASPA
ncbi:MAG TPA: methylenetetrahydrofolate reductase C-terminal domain-containing protein [Anaerolineales bacterium]